MCWQPELRTIKDNLLKIAKVSLSVRKDLPVIEWYVFRGTLKHRISAWIQCCCTNAFGVSALPCLKALGHSAANLTCLQCQLVSGYCACDATVMVNLTWPSAESEHMPAFIGNQWTNLCGKSVKTVQFASASSHLHFFGWYYCLKQNCTHQLLRNVQHIGRFCIRKGQKIIITEVLCLPLPGQRPHLVQGYQFWRKTQLEGPVLSDWGDLENDSKSGYDSKSGEWLLKSNWETPSEANAKCDSSWLHFKQKNCITLNKLF